MRTDQTPITMVKTREGQMLRLTFSFEEICEIYQKEGYELKPCTILEKNMAVWVIGNKMATVIHPDNITKF